MINIPYGKIYNSYIIETYNYDSVKNSIKEFAIANGFDKSLVYANTHPDMFFIESMDKNIPIDTVRKGIVESAIYSPKLASRKIYVVYDAIYLEEVAQNALLKTLEEPPAFDTFFLVTSNVNKFLETIRSRCVIIKDNEEANYKNLLNLEYVDDAIKILANLKYEPENDKMNFADIFSTKDNSLRPLIMLYRYILRDAMYYKMTLSKKEIILKEKEEAIISIANTFTMEEFGKLINNLDLLADANRYNVNKKIAVYNFFEV